MKQASVRELRNNYSKVLRWVERGEEVEVTRRGVVVARVVPPAGAKEEVDWGKSAAVNRPPWSKILSSDEVAGILADSRGDG